MSVTSTVAATDGKNGRLLLCLQKTSPSQFPGTNLVQTAAGEVHKIMQSHKS
jgi:hypothetical protein